MLEEVNQNTTPVQSLYGLINSSNVVINRVLWNGIDPITWNNSLIAIVDPTGISQIGGTWTGTTFQPPTATQTPQPTSTAVITIVAPSTFGYYTNSALTQGTSPYTVAGTETYFVIPPQTSMALSVNVTAGTPPFTISWPTQGPSINTGEFVQTNSTVVNNSNTNLIVSNTTTTGNNTTFQANINVIDGNGITTVITIPIND